MQGDIKMSKLASCGGCGAKVGAGMLSQILQGIPTVKDENLLVGYDTSDDAAIYKVSDDLAIVQTLDFFPPIVDDPYMFGQIAAANAISDIYAMGGDVRTALNIVCFPEAMDLNILGRILQGGSEDADSVNDASLCTLFTAGNFRFLDTGDAEADAEQRLVDTYGPTLHATLFKAGHHGSYTSNSLTFMQAVRPEAVAVSCGLHNDYGHPHRAALQNYAEVGAEVWRTDLEGSLTFIWQNNTLNVETSADSADFAA